jgi:hypothetical protein
MVPSACSTFSGLDCKSCANLAISKHAIPPEQNLKEPKDTGRNHTNDTHYCIPGIKTIRNHYYSATLMSILGLYQTMVISDSNLLQKKEPNKYVEAALALNDEVCDF